MALRSLAARLLLSTGTLAALFLAAEVALWASGRIADPQEFRFRQGTAATRNDSGGRYRRHATRFYELAPRFRAGPGHLGRDALGDWPFRGRPPEPSPPGLLRVVLVGDSCIYGAMLDACDCPAWRVARELDARGLPPDRVQVLSFGVPGYSTVQIASLLDEVLAGTHPDAVVLYPAAWNDQGPVLREPDRELLQSLADPSPLDWLAEHSRVAAAVLQRTSALPMADIMDGWEAGRPPLGWRVPAEDVGPNVAEMLRRCAAAGVPAVVIAPPHPPATLAEHPRTAQDAAAVLAAARRAGVPALDGQQILVDSGEDLGRFFADYVHPSPDGIARLVPPLADALLPLLAPRLAADAESLAAPEPAADTPASGGAQDGGARDGGPPHAVCILSVEPAQASRFGDAVLHVRLAGWQRGATLPAVIVGGAPLIDLHAVADDAVEGWLMANGAGTHDVVVQTARGCALERDAVRLTDPELWIEPGPPAVLAARGRPGDALRLYVATARRAVPQWSNRGASWLIDARPFPTELVLDGAGRAALPLPPLPAGRVLVQALLTPRGETRADRPSTQWTGVCELALGP